MEPCLKNVQFPEGIEAIGGSMFDNCKMQSFMIPDTVRIIESGAFDNTHFVDLFIPDSVSMIGYCAIGYGFDYNEKSATSNISIPGTIDEIDNKAFGYRFVDGKWFINLSVRGHKVTPQLSKFLNANKQNLKIIFVDALSNEIPAQYRTEMTRYWAEKAINNESNDPMVIKSYIKYLQNHKADWLNEPKPENEIVFRFMMHEKLLTASETETLVKSIKKMPELKASLIDYQNNNFSFEDYDKETEKEFKKMQRDAEDLSEPGSQKYINAIWTAARKNPHVKTLKNDNQIRGISADCRKNRNYRDC